jgi:hypothetical protein
MASADRYMHYAAECVRVAQQIQDSADKTMLLDMAQMWRRLAEIAENMERANAGDDELG